MRIQNTTEEPSVSPRRALPAGKSNVKANGLPIRRRTRFAPLSSTSLYPRAPFLRRAASHTIDVLAPFPFVVPFFPPWVVIVLGYALLADGMSGGVSVGKRLMGLRTVCIRTGYVCNPARSALRNLCMVMAALFGATVVLAPLGTVLVLTETLMALFRPDGRRLGDLLAGTQVVAAEAVREEAL